MTATQNSLTHAHTIATMSQKENSRRRLEFDGIEDRSCELCGCWHTQMSSPSHWRNERAHELAASFQVNKDSLVCRPCRQDVSRMLTDHTYVPRWREKRDTNMCGISDCTESAFVCSKMASSGTMKLAMERMGVACSLHERPEPTRLCKYHYCIIHIILQPPQTNCATYNISLRHCNSMPCPQPEVIQQHLRENTDFEGHVEAQDKVCLPAINVIS